MRTASSVHQRLEAYWLGLGLCLPQMDIPAINLGKTDDVEDTSPLMMDAVEMYLSIKRKDNRTFIRVPPNQKTALPPVTSTSDPHI